MRTPGLFGLTLLMIVSGCAQTRPDAATSRMTREVTVSAGAPHVPLDDGTRIAVDGIPNGESVPLQITETTNDRGQQQVDIDTPAKTR